ncbi:MAG: hypothetical protein WC081_04565, partial [Candidatus Ratteibacteria bacterium]
MERRIRTKACQGNGRPHGLFIAVIAVVFAAWLLHLPAALATPTMPANTSAGIHAALTFNYYVTNPNTEAGLVDYVWGSIYSTQPTGVYNTQYVPYDRAQVDSDLTWFQNNHPDWIVYQNDRTTIAYECGDSIVPLDISNPDVLDFIFDT